jgi:hypothetical protein
MVRSADPKLFQIASAAHRPDVVEDQRDDHVAEQDADQAVADRAKCQVGSKPWITQT